MSEFLLIPTSMVIGVVLGLLASGLPYCRFGWHKWLPWSLTGTGNGQYRNCIRCGWMAVEVFSSFTITKAQAPAEAKEECATAAER